MTNTHRINITKQAVIALSGGMDSTSLLLRLLADNYQVSAISFDYGQKHTIELEKAKALSDELNQQSLPVKHHIIELKGLSALLDSALVKGGDNVPEGHYCEKSMRLTVVPNRNKIFSSIIQSVALSIATANNTEVIIAMGMHAGDHEIYPDCRAIFRDKDYVAFVAGNWEADRVSYYLPYIDKTKAAVLEDGLSACQQLMLDPDKIYQHTFTSYIPLKHNGIIYSDYKSASSIERIEAFMALGKKDPIEYADEQGPVDWEVVTSHAQKIINAHQKNQLST